MNNSSKLPAVSEDGIGSEDQCPLCHETKDRCIDNEYCRWVWPDDYISSGEELTDAYVVATVGCPKHYSKAGEICDVRSVACSFRRTAVSKIATPTMAMVLKDGPAKHVHRWIPLWSSTHSYICGGCGKSKEVEDGPAEGIDNTPWMDYEDAGKEAYAEEHVIVFRAKPTGQKFAAHPDGRYIDLDWVEPASSVVGPKCLATLDDTLDCCAPDCPCSQPTPVVVPDEECKDCMDLLKERDELEERLDKLAEAISEHFEVPIGEHSSANDPIEVALEILGGGYKTKYDNVPAPVVVSAEETKETHPCPDCGIECSCTLEENHCWHECNVCDCGHELEAHAPRADEYGHRECSKCSCARYVAVVGESSPSLFRYDGNEAVIHACGLLDVIKQEWAEAWTEHDQAVRDGLSRMLSTHPAPLPSNDAHEELLRAAKEAYLAMAGNNNPFDAELWSKAVLGLEWAIALAESRAALPVGEKESH